MAGRIVVLEFDDRHQADAFVSQELALQYDGARAIAVFIRPDAYCQCHDKQRVHVDNWRKGKRTGLYLCVTCKKPSKHHRSGILDRLQYVFGYNQLKGANDE